MPAMRTPVASTTSRFFTAMAALALLALLAALGWGCSSPQEAGSQAGDAAPQDEPLKVASLKGPTTIGLAALMEPAAGTDDQEQAQALASTDGGIVFEIFATADEIAPKLASGDVDIALIPANLAATLYQKTDGSLAVIDVNTLGVLYALTADPGLQAAEAPTMADLAGRTVYLTGKGTVPEYTVRCLLAAAGVAEDAVDLRFCSEPQEVVANLAQDSTAVGIVPQPFATAAPAQNPAIASIMDLSAQWDALAADAAPGAPDQGRMVTGVTVVRADTLQQRPQDVAAFLEAHAAAAQQANDDPASIADTVVELGIVGSAAIAEKAIPLCNVTCLTGDDMKQALSGYLQALFDLAPEAVGGSLPDDGFYCTAVGQS